ncbi:efflux RND transporter periplasmic adaptor subunit [Muricoccus pecuniae]|uniref:RND family efflux transporter MFP subunit n=1 Tax=Muricoccus pecuniae TaxID=693023 RepID=A0A840YMZ1_9PROT|nr:efflux RND transporter periplasmic adaptor subunit [Roseomonas pecuniae]MBB5696543.1 RND family efflux transporter MFP subunit [Roseomonas pecuniae]
MRRKTLWITLASLAAAMAIGAAAYVVTGSGGSEAAQGIPLAQDPRQAPPLLLAAMARPVEGAERSFTGTLGARVQSDLAFRVGGKVTARLVDVGQSVRRGESLARLDDKDLGLALTARRNAVVGARATVVQAEADEVRYRKLLAEGWVSRQRYEATRAGLDTARASLAAAEAQAEVAANEAAYATLRADTDGVVTGILAEPGTVVAAGQPVVRLAQAGPREAVVNLPEGFRPALGTRAEATVYGQSGGAAASARLRQLSDAADPASRTYEARYVLEGDAAQAPLGSTVTLRVSSAASGDGAVLPVSALRDDGRATGVWILDAESQTVRFRAVRVQRLGAEQMVVEGVRPGERVAALGAHLLRDGQAVRVDTREAAR